jgi:hypothetical protein
MTRAALLARRAVLLPIYQNPNPEHELQAVEVECELAWIGEQLRSMPREPAPKPEPRGRGWKRDGKASAVGRDE